MRNAKVELIDVASKGCGHAGLFITNSTSESTVAATRCEFANSVYGAALEGNLLSAKFNNCVFNGNSVDGIFVSSTSRATIHLHGEDTAIYSNGYDIWGPPVTT